MDIIIILLLAAALYKISLHKPITTINDEYFSLEQCKSLKGIFAIIVILHHISQKIKCTDMFAIFNNLGFLATAMFFFISGYGLTLQLSRKGKNYLHNYFSKRITSILIPYIIMFALYSIYARLENGKSLTSCLLSLKSGSPVVSNSWYIIALLIFYIAFYFSGKLYVSNHKKLFLLFNFCFLLIYCFTCYNIGYHSWWYNTTNCFFLGIIWSHFEKQILAFINKYYLLLLIVFIGSFSWLSYYSSFKLIPMEIIIITELRAITFVISIVLICMKVKFNSPIMKKIGNVSFEFYMIQGLVIMLLQKYAIDKFSRVVFIVCGLIISYIAAFIFNKIDRLILNK